MTGCYHDDPERLIAVLRAHLEFPIEELWNVLQKQQNDKLERQARDLGKQSHITSHVVRHLIGCILDERRVELLRMMSEQPEEKGV